jgi:hypothetical protein
MPALHLLRRVFETARDYAEARALLERTPIAAPAIFTLVGLTADETCVVERDTEAFATRDGVASAANVWRYGTFPCEWHGGRASEEAQDSAARAALIETWAGARRGSVRVGAAPDPQRHDAFGRRGRPRPGNPAGDRI